MPDRLGVAGAIGLLAGFFGGLVGLGGGVVMVPLLTGWARLTQHEAHGTSLVGVVATGLVGALAYAQGGAVHLLSAGVVAATSVVATYLAARRSRRVSAESLRTAFGAFLILTAVLLPLKDQIPHIPAPAGVWVILVLVASGVLVGAVSGFLGIGGGSLLVPLLVFGAGLGQHAAQGTSLAAMVPAGASGTWVHARLGHVRSGILWTLLPGIAVGSWLGGKAALSMPAFLLRAVFAVVLLGLGLYYVAEARRGRGSRRGAEG